MREILFRAKRIDTGNWVEGNYCEQPCFGRKPIPSIQVITSKQNGCVCEYEMKVYEVDPNTVCQFTGLTDKNGKKIFEGDVIRNVLNTLVDNEPFWVEYCSESACYIWKDKEQQDPIYQAITDYCEVIGNIHDEVSHE